MNRPTIKENDKYGKLTVLYQKHSDKHGNAMYYCKCECGNRVTVRGCHLRNGHTVSCGCRRAEAIKEL